MWQIILEKIMEYSPIVLFILLIVIGTIYVVWFVAKFYFERYKKIEEKTETLPCAERHDYMKSIDNKLESLKDAFEELKTAILATNDAVRNVYSIKKSPRQLNEVGLRLYIEFNGYEFLQANKEKLLKAIEMKKPKTALDVEMIANEVLICHLNDDMFNGLKDWVYNSPSQKIIIDGREVTRSVSMKEVCFILSLPLRDMYLETHPF